MYQSAHHTKCLSEMTKISKSYTLETFNGRNFPGTSKDKSLTTNKHPKITTDPRIGVTKPCCRRWPNGYVKVAEPRHQNDLCFFFVGECNIFFGCKKPKNNTYGTLEIHFFLLGWFLFWFRGISKHKLWSTFLWCWNMQSSKDMLNLKHMRQGWRVDDHWKRFRRRKPRILQLRFRFDFMFNVGNHVQDVFAGGFQ